MLKEISTSLKAQLYERVSSPVLGSILVFWLIFNWEAVLYFLLSGSAIEEKLVYIESNFKNFDRNVFYPLLYSSLFCLLYPIVSYIPFYIWEWTSSHKLRSKSKLSLSEPLSIENSIAIRRELIEKEAKIRRIISENNIEKGELEKIIDKLSRDNERLYKVISRFESIRPAEYVELSEDQERVLTYFSNLKDNYQYTPSDIIGDNDVSLDFTVKALNQLEKKGLLNKSGDTFGYEEGYQITNAGRKYLADKVISEHEKNT
ncbi:hypothetical protein [Thiopseudomonas alkaliphila]|uniref:hypothetical protein n=1 Tax=Thiopseudomonas alkaliphila TaxID=1697053 RepID=UPI00069CCFA7|nr:hypothetical protein [Thiopseudomonas alkaliphila]AKX50235.1 hypothetical protein AKN92_01060 [Thiopseudomonas alkaliphila]AKX56571.1 hypothetical protein AKN89_01060 [Thiopseudomonas alkaliphila]